MELLIRIELSNTNDFALIDRADSEVVSGYSWRKSKNGYAVASVNNKCVYMHRLINNTPSGFETDHINGNRLDNQRKNLRSATKSQNQYNRKYQCGIYTNSRYSDGNERFGSYITVSGKRIFLGYFTSYEDALSARLTAEECML